MATYTVPPGWTIEPLAAHRPLDELVITSDLPLRLSVTVDWRGRGFRSGISTTGRMTSTEHYSGRKWKQRLVDDACAWLHTLLTT